MSAFPQKILNVLIVDDDAVDRMALRRALNGTNFNLSVLEATDADAGIAAIAQEQPDYIFLDYNLPGRNGLELTKQIRGQGIRVPLIVLTGQGNEQTAVELMKAGASDYLPKDKLSSETIARLMRGSLRVYEAEKLIAKANQNLRDKNQQLEQQNRELERQRQHIFKQNLQLQEVSRLKSEFLATMSHELRTPLNAIIGFSQILLSKSKGPLTEKQQDMLSRVLANGRNLLDLINDILSLSKIEAGRLELSPKQMNLSQLVEKTADELNSLATQKSLALKLDISLTTPDITNDVVRLRQVLVNLLSNAIKFTESGCIHIQVSDHPERSGQSDELVIAVIDTGCGMTPEVQQYIFDPFHQVDQKASRQHSGTGLGLAITNSIVKMMQGDIEIESEEGKGSTFRVTLPRQVKVGTV